jgi:hypothetical protein
MRKIVRNNLRHAVGARHDVMWLLRQLLLHCFAVAYMDSWLLHLTRMDVGNTEDCMEQSPPCSRRQLLHALPSTIAPALFYHRPSMGSYLLHLTHMDVGNAEDCMEQSPPCSQSPV